MHTLNFIIFTRLMNFTYQVKVKNPDIKNILRFQGLAFRYGFYVLTAILIIFITAFLYTFSFSYRILLSDAEGDATNVTQLTIAKIRNILQPVEEVPRLLAKKLEHGDADFRAMSKTIQDFISENKEVYGSCIAFEPNQFDKKKYYYAPYYYEKADSVIFKMLGSDQYDYFQQDWYRIPKMTGKAIWSEPYFDKGGGDMFMCTYSVPFYRNAGGKRTFSGVVTMDISLASLRQIVDTIHVYTSGYGFLISRSGRIITFRDSSMINKNIRDIAKNSKDTNVLKATEKMIRGESGFVRLQSITEDKPSWMYYSPVTSTEWSFGLVFPSRELFSSFYDFSKRLISIFGASIIALLIVIILITQKFTRPIKRLVEVTRRIGQGDFHAPLPIYKAKDEIMQLSNSFSLMQEELQVYIDHLQETTSTNEKMQSELNVAHSIQMGMLPKTFPVRDDCEISALLEPARAIGGDLYDFIITSDDLLYLAIGDVSGKGVPGALFMAVARTLFRSRVGKDERISSILESMNKELSKENPNQMFVTFLAIIMDLKTGVMELCNAGHTQPLVLRKNGSIEKLTHLGGIPLGIYEETSYSSTRVNLKPDDIVVLYTDGVTEATNPGNELFGENNLVKHLGLIDHLAFSEIPQKLIEDVRNFAGIAEQSDDIAILVMKYKNNSLKTGEMNWERKIIGDTARLVIQNDISELHKLISKVDELTTIWSIPAKASMQINLAMEELVTNIIFYAYEDKQVHDIIMEFSLTPSGLMITTEDDGKGFNPFQQSDPVDITQSIENRQIGGLGIHFIKTTMDNIEYERKENKNHVTLTKNYK
jgi:phosphoserine phosphatase RsbU/P